MTSLFQLLCSSDHLATALGNAHLRAIALDLVADTGRLALVHQHDVADIDGHVAIDDPALLRGATRLRVLLGGVDAVDEHLVVVREDLDDLAFLAAILARDHLHGVTFSEFHVHSTSGANETMRMNFLSRSSRPTGPKMRVPRGVRSSLMMTAAFSSKRM